MSMSKETKSTASIGMNGKKQKSRLENILFKLKKTDVEDGSPIPNSSSSSPDQGLSQSVGEGSNDGNSPSVSTASDFQVDGNNGIMGTNRRASRKPSKRKRDSDLAESFVKSDLEGNDTTGSNGSQQTDGIDEREAQDQHAKPDVCSDKKEELSRIGCSVNKPGIRIKIERDDSAEWHVQTANNVLGFSTEMRYQQEGDEIPEMKHYSCEKCGETFDSLHELDMHVDTHLKQELHNFSVHPCHICGRSFANEDFLSRHMSQHDTEVAQSEEVSNTYLAEDIIHVEEGGMQKEYYKCYRCRRVFSSDDALQLHKCRKGLVRPYGCGQCGRCFTHFSILSNHKETAHKDGLVSDLECFECGQRFMYSIELRRHVNIHLKAAYMPVSLRKSRTSTNTFRAGKPLGVVKEEPGGNESLESLNLVLPLSRLAPEKKSVKRSTPQVNPCGICGKVFFQRSYLTMHMKVHSEKKYICPLCGKKFAFKKSMEIHVRAHTGEKPYHCETCGKNFTRQDSLQKHQRMHLGVKPYVCETCGRQFGDKFELQRHMLSHTQEKPHKCNVCGKAYNDKKRLKEHMFNHSGTLPFKCEICGKGYARNYRFQQHMDQHAGMARHKCEVCSKGFYRRGDLNSHMQTHSSSKPFKCVTCGMGFLRDSYLRRHLIVHSVEKPHHCSICGKDFARKNTLRRHIDIHKRKNETRDLENAFLEINERYKNFTTDFGYGISGSVAPLPVSNSEERDIMKDIQAVIGLEEGVSMFE